MIVRVLVGVIATSGEEIDTPEDPSKTLAPARIHGPAVQVAWIKDFFDVLRRADRWRSPMPAKCQGLPTRRECSPPHRAGAADVTWDGMPE
jgi:hypothetical protein